jgi:UDP-N-acetyl-D-galactosamine dehydrogenase
LQSWNINVVVVDPWADSNEVNKVYGLTLDELSEELKVDSLIVSVGHDQFRELSPVKLRQFCTGDLPVLADVKSLFNKQDVVDQGFSVFRL